MEKLITTSVKISEDLEERLLIAVVKAGYGMKGKSRWITEAIEEFFKLPTEDMLDYVDIASEGGSLRKVASFRLRKDLSHLIDDGVITVRKKFPSMEGVKSNIVRASIMQKLLRDGY